MNFKDVADRYDAWYQTPLGSLAHALESEAIFDLAEAEPAERAVDIGGELNRFSPWAAWRRLKGLFTDTIYNQAHFWGRRELERLLQRKGFRIGATRILLHFPPVPSRTFLKGYRLFEVILRKLAPGTGAFIAMKAERGGSNQRAEHLPSLDERNKQRR